MVPVPADLPILLGALSPLGLAVLIVPLFVPCQLDLLCYKTLTPFYIRQHHMYSFTKRDNEEAKKGSGVRKEAIL